MRYPLVLFDFDGTLVDSFAAAVEILEAIGPNLGLKPIPDLNAARSLPSRQVLKLMGVRFWQLPRVVRAYHAAAAERSHGWKLHNGIAEMLEQLQSRGHRLGILSSNREDVIRTCLQANEVESRFAFVIGHPQLFGKAKVLRQILRTEKYPSDQMLFVGDEVRDIEAGHQAGVATVAVTWGFHTEPLLRAAEPRYLVQHPGELITVAESEN